MQMRRMRDESFRSYAARVRGKADTCAFSAYCSCGLKVNYSNHMIRDTLLNRISDFDIRREILGTADILTTVVNDVIALVRAKKWHEARYLPVMCLLSPLLGAKKATIISKNCRSSSRIPSPANPSKQSSVLFVSNTSTCIKKALVGGIPNRTLYASIASAHVAATSIAISRHLR